MRHQGRTIRYLEKHQGIAMDFHYLDARTGREFDVRDLPNAYIGDDRDAVLGANRSAHKRVIARALDAGYDFLR